MVYHHCNSAYQSASAYQYESANSIIQSSGRNNNTMFSQAENFYSNIWLEYLMTWLCRWESFRMRKKFMNDPNSWTPEHGELAAFVLYVWLDKYDGFNILPY